MNDDFEYQTENPHETTGRFTRFSRSTDKMLLAVIIAITLLVWQMTTMLVAVMVGIVLLLPLYQGDLGRLYRLVIRRFSNKRIQQQDNVIWQRESRRGRKFQGLSRPWKNPLRSIGVGTLGVLHDGPGQSDTVVITGEGSDMAALNLREQVQAHYLFADAMKRAASVRRHAVGMSLLFMRRPADILKYRQIEEHTVHPEVAIPEALFKDEAEWTEHDHRMMALAMIQAEDEELRQQVACNTTMAVSLTVRHDAAFSSALKQEWMSRRKVSRLVLSRIASNAVRGLQTFGAKGLRVLSDEGIEDFIREGWDVVGTNEYRIEAAIRRERKAAGEKVSSDPIYWPSERILAFNDHLIMDDTYHTVYRMTANKRLLTIGEMRRLCAVDIPWVTITLVGEAVNSTGQYRMFNFMLNLLDDTKEVFGIGARGPRADRIGNERKQRLADMDSSGYTQAYNIVAVVSAPSYDQLVEWGNAMHDYADYLQLKPEQIIGEDFQLPAVFSGLTGINML